MGSKINWKYISIAVIVAFLIGTGILCWQWYVVKKEVTEPEGKLSKENILQPKELLPISEVAAWETYKSDSFGFEIKYPADLFKITPYGGAIVFYHSFPFEWSNMAGDRFTELWDLTISFTIDWTDFNSAIKKHFSAYPEETYGGGPGIIAGHRAWWGMMGAEGINSFYYFIKLNRKKTFVVRIDSIWEGFDGRLLDEKDFLSAEKQYEIFIHMLSTLKFIQ